jgi:hypothetical protein
LKRVKTSYHFEQNLKETNKIKKSFYASLFVSRTYKLFESFEKVYTHIQEDKRSRTLELINYARVARVRVVREKFRRRHLMLNLTLRLIMVTYFIPSSYLLTGYISRESCVARSSILLSPFFKDKLQRPSDSSGETPQI